MQKRSIGGFGPQGIIIRGGEHLEISTHSAGGSKKTILEASRPTHLDGIVEGGGGLGSGMLEVDVVWTYSF